MGTPGKVAQHAAKGNLFYGDVQLVRHSDDALGCVRFVVGAALR